MEKCLQHKQFCLELQPPGVNGPTWNALESTFLMLGLCLAFSSSDSWLILNVTFLVLITGSLFLLPHWFLFETGLVSVKNQMEELQLAPKSQHKKERSKQKPRYIVE